MNSRSSQVLLYTAGGGGRSPSAPACLPAASCHPPTLLWWGRQGRQSSGRGVWAPGPRTELCHRCPSDPFLSWASVSPSAKQAHGHAPPAPLLGAPATHSSLPRRSRRRRQRSPCPRHRASARGHRRGCQGRRRSWGRTFCLLRGEQGDAETQRLGRRPRCCAVARWGLCVCWGRLSLPGPPPHPDPRPRLTAVSCLVRAIPAVVAAVTEPLLGDAAMVLALKLGLGAELVWGSRTEVTVRRGRGGGLTVRQTDATGRMGDAHGTARGTQQEWRDGLASQSLRVWLGRTG